jgi:RimJ/RimL family protein N-acetyltransferase
MSVKPVFPDEIFTPRLILSRPRPTDFADLRRFATNEQVMATLGGVQTEEQTRVALERHLDHWQRHGFGWWTMRDRAGGTFSGRGGLRHFVVAGREEIELGYGLLPDYWGQGLAAEMSREALSLGFETLGIPSIVAFTLPTNQRSRRVMEKVGFRYECDTIHAELPHVLYRVTASDWRFANIESS